MSCFLFCLLRARNILLSWRGYVLFQNVAAGAGGWLAAVCWSCAALCSVSKYLHSSFKIKCYNDFAQDGLRCNDFKIFNFK